MLRRLSNPQLIGTPLSGASYGTLVAPSGTAGTYGAWTLLGTTGGPINWVAISMFYPTGGSDIYGDIGIGSSSTSVTTIVQAIRFNSIITLPVQGPLFIPPNTQVWARINQVSNVGSDATISLMGWWKDGAPIVPVWYVCGMTYGSTTGGPTLTAGTSGFGTPVQYSTPAVNLKRLWIAPLNLTYTAQFSIQTSIGPSGSQQIVFQQNIYSITSYTIFNFDMLELNIEAGTPVWLASASASVPCHVLAAAA